MLKADIVVIQITGFAGLNTTTLCENSGEFLVSYDPDAAGGRGSFRSSPDPRKAAKFASAAAAHAFWARQSRTRPLRDDGEPNGPLTAFTVLVLPLADVAA
jgi:hypothetical protein